MFFYHFSFVKKLPLVPYKKTTISTVLYHFIFSVVFLARL